MPDMPQRPASHINAQKSEKAFAALFDDGSWVIRPVTPDYGRDLEVELFEGNRATGVLFGAQLKSIEKAPRKGRLAKPGIETSSLHYWRSLDYPLLIATYSVPADQFFARWAHGYDWHHKSHLTTCDDSCRRGPKTVTLNYNPTHRMTRDFIERLPSQLHFFRVARSGDLRRHPMPIRVTGDSIDGHPLLVISNEIGQIAGSFQRIRFAEPDELAVSLTYSEKSIKAVLPGEMRSATIHLKPGIYSSKHGAKALAADGVAALSWLFIELKADNAAADLILASLPNSIALFETSFHRVLVPELLDAGREDVVEALAGEESRRLRRRPWTG